VFFALVCSCDFCASLGEHRTDCPRADVLANSRSGEKPTFVDRRGAAESNNANTDRERSRRPHTRFAEPSGPSASGHDVQYDYARALSDPRGAAEDMVNVSNSVLDRIAVAIKVDAPACPPARKSGYVGARCAYSVAECTERACRSGARSCSI
jgi:hypothetical protein